MGAPSPTRLPARAIRRFCDCHVTNFIMHAARHKMYKVKMFWTDSQGRGGGRGKGTYMLTSTHKVLVCVSGCVCVCARDTHTRPVLRFLPPVLFAILRRIAALTTDTWFVLKSSHCGISSAHKYSPGPSGKFSFIMAFNYLTACPLRLQV